MFPPAVLAEFEEHSARVRVSARARQEAVRFRSVVQEGAASDALVLGQRAAQDEWQGDANLRTLRSLLALVDERGFERSAHQRAFHAAFERATARVIYKNDWGTKKPLIMRKNGWQTSSSEVLISTPRRFGKTFSIAIFTACLALSMKCEIVVFSPARRASRKLLERMIEFVRLLGHEPLEYNQEQARVRSYDGHESLIRSFPSKVSSLKGVAGDVIILEEAAYCDPGLISEVVVPLLSMSNSVLLCISTLLESGNHYSKMFDLVDSVGRKLFESISITLVCDKCMQSEHPERCTHKLAEMPRWLSSSKMETVKALLNDDPAMLLRESMGICADGSNKAFPSKDVDAWLQRVRLDVPEVHASEGKHFVLAVDPAGGGASAFAVCSMFQLHTGQVVLLGVDLLRTKDVRATHRLVADHIASVRSVPGMADATCVLQLESNLAFECQHIIHALQAAGVKKWVALSEGAGGTLGWLTTNERKEAMCFQLRDALRVGCLYLSSGFFSVMLEEREAVKTLRDELCRFAIVTEPAKTLFGKVRKTYTGKLGGLQDDLAICLQLCITGLRCFYQSDKYANFRPE